MKAVVQERYGPPDVLELREVDEPVPGDDQVLVRVRAASVHPGDWLLMMGRPYVMRLGTGLRRPRKRTPGFDLAGTVEAVGDKVQDLRPGDGVFGKGNGTCCEYVAVDRDTVAPKPAGLTFEQAAAVTISGVAALRAVRDQAKVQPGQKVLINGASGGVGTFAVQIAKALGAEVTGVCSGGNADLVRSIGADRIIDYTREDFTRGDRRYDFILDNAGNHSLAECRRVVAPGGTLIPNNGTSGGRWMGTVSRILGALLLSPFVRRQGRPFVSMEKQADILALKELIEAGRVTPVIERSYPLSETARALEHVGQGHARGKIVITV
jgi:NADPH:quinone reductase-like Zn-dependent oxidoreductase